MADLAKYQQDLQRFNTRYLKEAIKEPYNFWGLAGFAIAAACSGSVIPLLLALIAEAIYLVIVPNLPLYRQMVVRRQNDRMKELHRATREKLIKSFTPREREVLFWVRRGKSNAEVGAILGITTATVGKHLERIYPKLGVENRTAASSFASDVIEHSR